MTDNNPSIDQIRARAYQIYLQRGRQPGQAIDDWLQAQSELLQLPVDEPAAEVRRHQPDKLAVGGLARPVDIPAAKATAKIQRAGAGAKRAS